MEKTKLVSRNIDCPHCIENIKHKIGNVYGVARVEGDPARKEVTVTYDPAKIGIDAIKDAMADAGYPVAA
ncbi:MAG: heavy-metal-associated domain-containing protein [Chloroflexi bacterium]|nr:heavy-metal-associated domain-containing protein [Chloroflexota bacterium]